MITVSCSICQQPYQIKRKTCKDDRLVCKACKYERRTKNFALKYGTTPAKHYSSRYKGWARSWKLENEYGLSLDDYNKLLENQNGVCVLYAKSHQIRRNATRICASTITIIPVKFEDYSVDHVILCLD